MNYDEIDRLMNELGMEVGRIAEQTGNANYCYLQIGIRAERISGAAAPKVEYRISVLGDGKDVSGATRLQDLVEEFNHRCGWVDRQKQQALPAPSAVSFAPVAPPAPTDIPF